MNKVEWLQAEQDYTRGVQKNGVLRFPTQKELAKKFNVSKDTIAQKCSTGKWVRKREEHLIKLTEKLQKKSLEKSTDLILKTRERHRDLWRRFYFHIQRHLNQDLIEPLELTRLAGTLTDVVAGELKALGFSEETVSESVRTDAARAEYRKKLSETFEKDPALQKEILQGIRKLKEKQKEIADAS